MNKIDELSAFEAINNNIRSVLYELDDLATQHPWFDCEEHSKNNAAFIKFLDDLLELKNTVVEAEKYYPQKINSEWR